MKNKLIIIPTLLLCVTYTSRAELLMPNQAGVGTGGDDGIVVATPAQILAEAGAAVDASYAGTLKFDATLTYTALNGGNGASAFALFHLRSNNGAGETVGIGDQWDATAWSMYLSGGSPDLIGDAGTVSLASSLNVPEVISFTIKFNAFADDVLTVKFRNTDNVRTGDYSFDTIMTRAGFGNIVNFSNMKMALVTGQNANFKVTAISRPGNGTVQLSFPSNSGQNYGVESSLTLGTGSWVDSGLNVAGNAGIQTITVPDANSIERRFFRVKEQGSPPLASPGNPAANVYSSSQVNFTWNDVVGETGYEVQWADNSGFASPTTLPAIGPNTTSALVTGLSANTPYWFRVRALKTGSNPSGYAVMSATTQGTNTSPVISTGGGALASSQPYGGEEADKGFDDSVTTKWLGNMTPEGAWLSYDFVGDASYRVTGFKITSGFDDLGRHPRNFKLQGSLDGGNTWVDIAGTTVANQPYGSQYNVVEYGCPANTVAYPMVRLFISANNGSTENYFGGTGLVQLAELQLLGVP